MEKNKLLKVSSILLIIFGVVVALFAILVFCVGDLAAALVGSNGTDMGDLTPEAAEAAVRMAVTIMGVAMLILGIGYIAAGVVGVMQKSATTCFVVAIVLIVLCGISAILDIIGGSIVPAILGLVVPVLYLVGAIQLKKSVADEALTSTPEERL